MPVAAARCVALGKTSFEDCPRFTSSLAWTPRASPRSPPSSSEARLASTSFTFMLLCVPDPVCQTESGNSCAWRPASTSSAAAAMAPALSAGSSPSSPLTRAAAALTATSARTRSSGRRSLEIEKCSSERCVCAPQSRSAGTSMPPKESRSRRVALIVHRLSGKPAFRQCSCPFSCPYSVKPPTPSRPRSSQSSTKRSMKAATAARPTKTPKCPSQRMSASSARSLRSDA
ncbi:MAG: hypothetical protein AW09_001733 [Candidatus Accumulibacter phosphatis]|uniref:Uncharacterized protein n=1 Tax=Candidatus Accumulibacter phosphatis TaxID=327160 RepID=A0A080LWM9_9PROT|nr:MAG: hypothetical protein AW09_001733 [Candidatus Accumulibacter phosphatis]